MDCPETNYVEWANQNFYKGRINFRFKPLVNIHVPKLPPIRYLIFERHVTKVLAF